MLRLYTPLIRNRAGLTLIELMVVVAIIGILGIIAIPTFVTYRNKSRVATVVASAESMRTALAGYAVTSPGNLYPLTDVVKDWESLREIINANGGSLNSSLEQMLITNLIYTSDDGQTYTMEITVSVPINTPGYKIEVSPSGVFKSTGV
jgi:prepilin-type N-terminal cleavage/methylation domain-containing protein